MIGYEGLLVRSRGRSPTARSFFRRGGLAANREGEEKNQQTIHGATIIGIPPDGQAIGKMLALTLALTLTLTPTRGDPGVSLW